MAGSAQPTAIAHAARMPLVRRGHARRLLRAPGRRGALTPEEAACALGAERAELRRRLDRRRDIVGVPDHVREEIVDEAIGLVVMSSKPIQDEQHLQGAFWASIGFLLAELRSGRRDLHVGSRRRVDFEPIANLLPDDDDAPFDVLAARERIATAADLMAQLDPFEQQVLAVMAIHGLGVKRTAKALGQPVKAVLAASRSARRKLDQVAAITAAGRMCDYRAPAIRAHAQGAARADQEQAAKAHIAACASCRSSYAALLREMNGREFRRAASAAFLPPPVLATNVHAHWIERLASIISPGRGPAGSATAERTAGLLGGGGLVKAAAATSAIVIAGAGVGANVIHSLTSTPAPTQHRRHHVRPRIVDSVTDAVSNGSATSIAGTRETSRAQVKAPAKHAAAPPPSHADGYLAIGGTADAGADPQAAAATASTPSPESAPASPAPPTGGGTSLSYLGR